MTQKRFLGSVLIFLLFIGLAGCASTGGGTEPTAAAEGTSEPAAPEEAAPEEAAPEGTAPEGTAPEGTAPPSVPTPTTGSEPTAPAPPPEEGPTVDPEGSEAGQDAEAVDTDASGEEAATVVEPPISGYQDLDFDARDDLSEQFPDDTDNDGEKNAEDDDDDADGIDDNEELSGENYKYDTDNDGLRNDQDMDDDADGANEAVGGKPSKLDRFPLDTDNDGDTNDDDSDDDQDGYSDSDETVNWWVKPVTPEQKLRFVLDTDNDGYRNDKDYDDDGDGFYEAVGGGRSTLDSFPYDCDNDGEDNHDDDDDDDDGYVDTSESISKSLNSDNDSILNGKDDDDDGDGLYETQNGQRVTFDKHPYDTDNDGNRNHIDEDDDKDGIADDDEAAGRQYDTDNDGVPKQIDLDDDGDGLYETQNGQKSTFDKHPYDTDNDGVINGDIELEEEDDWDADDDEDGILDDDEDPGQQFDTDNDGTLNGNDPDDDFDGLFETANGQYTGFDSYPFDTDNDKVKNVNDEDDDNDGRSDSSEDYSLQSVDSDNDGKHNGIDHDDDCDELVETNENGQSVDEDKKPFDTDNDGVKNWNSTDEEKSDPDDDNDGIEDDDEEENQELDSDNDGKLNQVDLDDDCDGLNEAKGGYPGGEDPKINNTDNAGNRNHIDEDDDNDGIADDDEISLSYRYDTDNDKKRNDKDLDDDCDGLNEAKGGYPGGDDPKIYDTDNDGLYNGGVKSQSDEDDDNDGIADLQEGIGFYEYEVPPEKALLYRVDSDNDAYPNDLDPDDDCDGLREGPGGVASKDDAFPYNTDNTDDSNRADEDDDNDGKVDSIEFNIDYHYDSDNDGYRNDVDKTPQDPTSHKVAMGDTPEDDADHDGIPDEKDPQPLINARVTQLSAYLANREVESDLFRVEISTLPARLFGQKDIGFLKLGYWLALEQQQGSAVVQANQDWNNENLTDPVETAFTVFDHQALIGLGGLDLALQKDTLVGHLGLILGGSNMQLLGRGQAQHFDQVDSSNQGLGLAIYALLEGQDSHLALSFQNSWFQHDLQGRVYGKDGQVIDGNQNSQYGSHIQEAVVDMVYPLALLNRVQLSSTLYFSHQWYSDDVALGEGGVPPADATLYQGKAGLRASTLFNQVTPFVEVDYHFGKTGDMVVQEAPKAESGAQPIFTFTGKPIPVDLSLQTGFNYALNDQCDLDVGVRYFKEGNNVGVVSPQTSFNLGLTYNILDNIVLNAQLEKLLMGDHADMTSDVQIGWKW